MCTFFGIVNRRILLLALLAACRPQPQFDESPAPLTVLVYNIHAGKDASQRPNLDRVAAVIRQYRAQLVLLQEVDRNTKRSGGVDQPAELARLTGMHVAFGKTLDYDGGEYGIAILSAFPMSADTLIHLVVDPPQQRAGGSYEPRGALRVEIGSPWGPLSVYNTHLDASRDTTFRAQEVRALTTLVEESRTRGLVLLGGDFNSTPESAEQSPLRGKGARDAWQLCGAKSDTASLTYPANTPIKRIDYLFLFEGLRCTHATVPMTEASDHRPLLVQVTR